MNLNQRFTSLALIAIVALAFLANGSEAQTNSPIFAGSSSVVPTPAAAGVQFGAPQVAHPAMVSNAVYEQVRPLGFSQFMGDRYQNIGAWDDYSPDLIGSHAAPTNMLTASRIGVATVTDYALGHGLHSPLRQPSVAQASYFQPVAPQQSVGAYNVVPTNFASANVIPPHIVGNVQPNVRPRLFGGTNIGGGRSIFKAFWDKHWTRMVLVYGGFGFSEDNGADIFDGQASSNLGIVGIDIGRRHSQFMRSSIDFTYRGGSVDFGGAEVGDVRVYSLMKNFHLDLAQRGRLRPYIGVGVGGAFLDAEADLGGNAVEVDEGSFAFQIMGLSLIHI